MVQLLRQAEASLSDAGMTLGSIGAFASHVGQTDGERLASLVATRPCSRQSRVTSPAGSFEPLLNLWSRAVVAACSATSSCRSAILRSRMATPACKEYARIDSLIVQKLVLHQCSVDMRDLRVLRTFQGSPCMVFLVKIHSDTIVRFSSCL